MFTKSQDRLHTCTCICHSMYHICEQLKLAKTSMRGKNMFIMNKWKYTITTLQNTTQGFKYTYIFFKLIIFCELADLGHFTHLGYVLIAI